MAKKTRKQKVLADLHRQQLSLNSPLTYSYKRSDRSASSIQPEINSSTSTIKRDIYKTLILASIFIGSEFLLFSLSRKFGW